MAIQSFRRILPASVCTRCLSTTTSLQSGHSRWSKIKHDKAHVDGKRTAQFSIYSHSIAQASRLYGGDPNTNPRLATVIATAKKASYPKSNIEAAIARGQGKSLDGKALESITLEAKFPPSIGLVIEAETDNKLRTLSELRSNLKYFNATATPVGYLFTKKGRVQFEKDERALGVDDVLDEAIEAGAEDVETDEEGNLVLWTEPTQTNQAAQALSRGLNLKIQSTDIIWDANEDTKATLDDHKRDDAPEYFVMMLEKLREDPSVQGIYSNIAQGNMSDEQWEDIESQLD